MFSPPRNGSKRTGSAVPDAGVRVTDATAPPVP